MIILRVVESSLSFLDRLFSHPKPIPKTPCAERSRVSLNRGATILAGAAFVFTPIACERLRLTIHPPALGRKGLMQQPCILIYVAVSLFKNLPLLCGKKSAFLHRMFALLCLRGRAFGGPRHRFVPQRGDEPCAEELGAAQIAKMRRIKFVPCLPCGPSLSNCLITGHWGPTKGDRSIYTYRPFFSGCEKTGSFQPKFCGQ